MNNRGKYIIEVTHARLILRSQTKTNGLFYPLHMRIIIPGRITIFEIHFTLDCYLRFRRGTRHHRCVYGLLGLERALILMAFSFKIEEKEVAMIFFQAFHIRYHIQLNCARNNPFTLSDDTSSLPPSVHLVPYFRFRDRNYTLSPKSQTLTSTCVTSHAKGHIIPSRKITLMWHTFGE